METLEIFLIAALAFSFSYRLLDRIIPDIETKRVGGMRFWRVGRVGGAFYIAKAG